MLHLIDPLPEKPPIFDTVLHLGAGPDFEESLYGKLPAKNYILVEADPEVAERLRDQAPDANFRVIESLLTGKECQQTFRRFSLSSLNGVFPLGALQALYPRAREVGSISLDSRTLSSLLDKLNLAPGGVNALILDLPGLESDLLESSLKMITKQFDWILVSGAGEPRMEGARPLSDALKLLQGNYFTLLRHDATSNPLTPCAILQRNTLALESESLRKERDALIKAKDEQAKLASERQSALEAAVKAKDEQAKLASERQSALEAAVKERDALKKTAGDRAARIAELEAQVADQAERQKQIDEQMIRAETQLEMLKEFMKPAFQ